MRLMAMKLALMLFALLLCVGCSGVSKPTSASCAASAEDVSISNVNYCITLAAASYQIDEQGSLFNTYSTSVTIQSNPPLPTGTTANVVLRSTGPTGFPLGTSGQIASTGSPTMDFSFTAQTPPTMTCLPTPDDVSVNVPTANGEGSPAGGLQVNWTSIPQACN
jgi:hypothetical protein